MTEVCKRLNYNFSHYEGKRVFHNEPTNGDVCATSVKCVIGKKKHNLDSRLDLYNHSPSGLEWGYNGSGPSQLALALLADYLGDDNRAKKLYQEFKRLVIANLNYDEWKLSSKDIDTALRNINSKE